MLSKLKSVFNLFYKKDNDFIDITKYGEDQYQDIIINNVVVKKANCDHNENQLRYKIIQKILDQYERPFEMLDIGAGQGYYSFRAAHDYDCVCVMIEGNNLSHPKVGSQLLDLCKANFSLDNIILLNKQVIPEDLKKLSECESFDIVLSLNIIQRYGPRWKEVADSILAMGNNAIIEIPPQEDHASKDENALRKTIEEYLVSKNAKILGEVPRHSSNKAYKIYLVTTVKNKLARKQWLTPVGNFAHLMIDSNFKAKTITKRLPHFSELQVNDWQPGINLMTFLMYNGAYPSRKQIKVAIKKIVGQVNNDWTVNNMILQGNKLILIDWGDPTHGLDSGRRSTPRVIKSHLRLVSLKDPVKIERYFYNRLIKT